MATIVYSPHAFTRYEYAQQQIERRKPVLELFIEFLGLVWRGLQWIGDFFQWLASLPRR